MSLKSMYGLWHGQWRRVQDDDMTRLPPLVSIFFIATRSRTSYYTLPTPRSTFQPLSPSPHFGTSCTMSKPSYAAVAASPPKDSHQPDAPPPYSGPSTLHPHAGQAQHPHPGQHAQHHPSYQTGHVYLPGQAESQGFNPHQAWTPPPSLEVARSRALRRFWVAFFWAWAIWILIGLMIGGGVSDIEHEPMGRHGHWGKHGRWHEDSAVYPLVQMLGLEADGQ
ncbi:hypothetical protein DB88DRAFT_496340 [Papiliotrema laurentii]|uniref:Uncharacterized protein n=1 Tax=Papiliotrema laurentii TaxID=5418 RepID=A0AAD9CXY6_PAPLA|nr:hypothetical protein DB88DRAFT_496340 [Papiliotrema laurentii]